MAPPDEPNATGGGRFSRLAERISGLGPRASVSSTADIQIPKIDSLRDSIKSLRNEITELQKVMAAFSQSGVAKKMAADYAAIAKSGTSAAQAVAAESKSVAGRATGGGFGGAQPNAWQTRDRKDPASTVKVATEVTSAGTSGGSGAAAPPTTNAPRAMGFKSGSSPAGADLAGGTSLGQGVGNTISNTLANVTGQNGIVSMLTAPLSTAQNLWGSLAGGSMQYAYNRINGPNGNMNAMLQLSQALAPNVTMMNAAGTNIDMKHMIKGLAQRMPIMGTQQDMLSTILAGQSVGALMSGTPGRNGFFESARQAQALMPGQAPATISGNIAGYIGNVGAQQRGAMLGEGAFTMVGQGGSYKTLAEWAHAITEFLEQHRPGGNQGKNFTKAELITQNFPGSNINTWFQFMGVPQGMVDYWWQYVLTDKQGVASDKITSDLLQQDVQKTRGINLGQEQLRTATQATRRDYLFGNQMYDMYALNASANRRFNVAMGGTDQALGQQLQNTNIGRMLALLPTPIMEMLMPILTQLASSPIGAAGAAVGGVLGGVTGLGGGGSGGGGSGGGVLATAGAAAGDLLNPVGLLTNPVGNVINAGMDIFGDPMPYGGPASVGWGEAGGTTTAHLSPDLAKRVQTMMAANPALQISSGYRDTTTQNRLRRNGATAVGHPSRSAHTRGWAADIGPASQMGWLMQNAGKFGLQTAANYGEPWHIQRSGTPLVGDPGSAMPYGAVDWSAAGGDLLKGNFVGAVSDVAGGALEGVAKAIFGMITDFMGQIMKTMATPLQSLLQQFIGKGGFTDMVDTATSMFSRLMTAPLTGLVNIGGKASDSLGEVEDLIQQPSNVSVPVVGSKFSGFSSQSSKVDSPIFGDPMPFGGPMSLLSPMPNGSSGSSVVIHLNAPITIKGDMKTGADARRMAGVLLDHLEDQASRRDWLRT